MKLLHVFVLILLVTSLNYSQNYKQVKIYFNTPEDIQVLQNAGLDFDHPHLTKDNAIFVLNLIYSDNVNGITGYTSTDLNGDFLLKLKM